MGNKIAVIDDDIGTSLFFKICLEDEGYIVDTFYDPMTFLDQFEPGVYTLLITDIRMPKINGFELVSRVKKMDKRIGVCLATAFEEYYTSIIESYKELDLNCLIKKPISKDALIEIIKDKLNNMKNPLN